MACLTPSQNAATSIRLRRADFLMAMPEEAWKRLIRVLGHELSNSLAPIKSIAGSLLARAEKISGDESTVHDFRRGLSVIQRHASN
jgi:nitrogen fixation/metabolism regulation signal transduction histidine kinase